MTGVTPSGSSHSAEPEPVPVSAVPASVPNAGDHLQGRIYLGTLPQPLRNGSHDVVMGWEAVRRPVRVCEGGGWYSRHPTETAWLLRTWMEHKGRPGWTFGHVADERDTDLRSMVMKAAQRRARNYCFPASGIEARSDETAQQARPKARARPDAQTPTQSPSYSQHRGSVDQ